MSAAESVTTVTLEPYGPLVCECAEPDADLRRNFGECRTCRRKPLALMAPAGSTKGAWR